MAEEKKENNEHKLSLGFLLLAAIVADLAIAWLGFSFPGIVIPFAVLAAAWYGSSQGFVVGAVGAIFSGLMLFSWSAKTWLDAIAAGIAALFGKGGKESNFLVRVLLATAFFEIVFQLNATDFVLGTEYYAGQFSTILLHFAANATIAIALAIGYLREED